MSTFEMQLRAFAEKATAKAELVSRKIIFDISTRLVLRSPVGDAKYWINPAPPGYVGGRFRANWQYGLGAPNLTTTEAVDPSGQASIGRIQAKAPEKILGHVHYLTNSLPYAQRIETGWSYRQAPQGVVSLTVLEFEPIVRAAADSL